MIAPPEHHKLARALCDSLQTTNRMMLHREESTDLILGGGCPRCNKFLETFAKIEDTERKACVAIARDAERFTVTDEVANYIAEAIETRGKVA